MKIKATELDNGDIRLVVSDDEVAYALDIKGPEPSWKTVAAAFAKMAANLKANNP
jgi:hypothetical protein